MKFPRINILFWLTALCFYSCSSDDINENGLASIAGKWTIKSVELQENTDIDNDGISTRNVLEDIPCYTASFNFQNNSSATFEASEIESSVVEGNSEIEFNCKETELISFLWRIEEDQLILTNPDNSSDIIIFEWALRDEKLTIYGVRTFQGTLADFIFIKN